MKKNDWQTAHLANAELETTVDEMLAKFDARLRKPLDEICSFFTWLRDVKFKSSSSQRIVAASLASDMGSAQKFESLLLSEEQVAQISAVIRILRQEISEMAGGKPHA